MSPVLEKSLLQKTSGLSQKGLTSDVYLEEVADTAMIDGFDVNLVMHTAIEKLHQRRETNEEPPLSRVLVHGDLPSLSLKMSGELTRTLQKVQKQFAAIWQIDQGTLSSPAKVDPSSVATSLVRSSSVTSVSAESSFANLVSQDSMVPSAAYSLDLQTKEAGSADRAASHSIRSKSMHSISVLQCPSLLECNFTIGFFCLTINQPNPSLGKVSAHSNVVNPQAEIPLFTVCVSQLSGSFMQNRFELCSSLRLHAFSVLDNLQPNGQDSEFTYLATSSTNVANGDLHGSDDLIHVNYQHILKAGRRHRKLLRERHLAEGYGRFMLSSDTDTMFQKIPNDVRPGEGDIDTYMHVEFNGLQVNWNPDTIAYIVDYMYSDEMEAPNDGYASPGGRNRRPSSQSSVPSTLTLIASESRQRSLSINPSQAVPKISSTLITANMRRWTINFNKETEGRGLARFEMVHSSVRHHHTSVVFSQSHGYLGEAPTPENYSTFVTTGQLGDLNIFDTSGADNNFPQIMDCRLDGSVDTPNGDEQQPRSLLDFSFTSFAPVHVLSHRAPAGDIKLGDASAGEEEMEPQTLLVVKLNSMRLVYLQRLIMELIDYFNQGVLGAITARLGSTVIPVQDMEMKAFHKTDITILNPLLIVPRHQRSKQYLHCDLGQIHITNAIQANRHKLLFNIKGCGMRAGALLDPSPKGSDTHACESDDDAYVQQLVASKDSLIIGMDLAVSFLLAEAEELRQPSNRNYFDLYIDMKGYSARCEMSWAQLVLILNVWYENICCDVPHTIPKGGSNRAAAQNLAEATGVYYYYADEGLFQTYHVDITLDDLQLALLHSMVLPSEGAPPFKDPLVEIALTDLCYKMRSFQDRTYKSVVTARRVEFMDAREHSKDWPHRLMISAPGATSSTKVEDGRLNISGSESLDGGAVETTLQAEDKVDHLEFAWDDFAGGERAMFLTFLNPTGYVVPGFWNECWDWLMSSLTEVYAAQDRMTEYKATHQLYGTLPGAVGDGKFDDPLESPVRTSIGVVSEAKTNEYDSANPEKQLAFRSFTLKLIGSHLVLPADVVDPASPAFLLSCDLEYQYSSSLVHDQPPPSHTRGSWQWCSWFWQYYLSNVQAYVCQADQPFGGEGNSVVSPSCLKLFKQSTILRAFRDSPRNSVTEKSPTMATSTSPAEPPVIDSIETYSSDVKMSPFTPGEPCELRASYEDFKLLQKIYSALFSPAMGASAPPAIVTPVLEFEHPASRLSGTNSLENVLASMDAPPSSITQGAHREAAQFVVRPPFSCEEVYEHLLPASTGTDLAVLRSQPIVVFSRSKTKISVEWSELTLVVINDCGGRFVPLLHGRLRPSSLMATGTQSRVDPPRYSSGMEDETKTQSRIESVGEAVLRWTNYQVECQLIVESGFFNPQVVSWEPLLEPNQSHISFRYSHDEAQDLQEDEQVEQWAPKMVLSMDFESVINYNLTYAFLSHMLTTISAWNDDLVNPPKSRSTKFFPYFVVNHTGGPLSYQCLKRSLSSSDPDTSPASYRVRSYSVATYNETQLREEPVVLDDGADQPLHALAGKEHVFRAIIELRAPFKLRVKLMGGWIPVSERTGHRHVKDLNVNSVGTKMYPLRQLSYPSPGGKPRVQSKRSWLFVDVALRNGSKVVTLRSPVRLLNNTGVPMLFTLHSSPSMDGSEVRVLGPVEPGTAVHIPYKAIHLNYISCRPTNTTLPASERSDDPSATSKSHPKFRWSQTPVDISQFPPPPSQSDFAGGTRNLNCLGIAVLQSCQPQPEGRSRRNSNEEQTPVVPAAVTAPSNETETVPGDVAVARKRKNSSRGGLFANLFGKEGQSKTNLMKPGQRNTPSELQQQQLPLEEAFLCHVQPAHHGKYGYQITLRFESPLKICNLFPFKLEYAIQYEQVTKNKKQQSQIGAQGIIQGSIEPGATAMVHQVDLRKEPYLVFRLPGYRWSEMVRLTRLNAAPPGSSKKKPSETDQASLKVHNTHSLMKDDPDGFCIPSHTTRHNVEIKDGGGNALLAVVESTRVGRWAKPQVSKGGELTVGAITLNLFCEYWISNKSLLDLVVGMRPTDKDFFNLNHDNDVLALSGLDQAVDEPPPVGVSRPTRTTSANLAAKSSNVGNRLLLFGGSLVSGACNSLCISTATVKEGQVKTTVRGSEKGHGLSLSVGTSSSAILQADYTPTKVISITSPQTVQGSASRENSPSRPRARRFSLSPRKSPEAKLRALATEREKKNYESVRTGSGCSGKIVWYSVHKRGARWSDSFDPSQNSNGMLTIFEKEQLVVYENQSKPISPEEYLRARSLGIRETRGSVSAERRSSASSCSSDEGADGGTNSRKSALATRGSATAGWYAAGTDTPRSSATISPEGPVDLTVSMDDYFGGDLSTAQLLTRMNRYDVGVQFTQAPGIFTRTKVITFMPRFMVVNKTDKCMLFRQVVQSNTLWTDGAHATVVEPNKYAALQYKDCGPDAVKKEQKDKRKGRVELAMACLSFEGYEWSGSFPIDQVGEVCVTCRLDTRRRAKRALAESENIQQAESSFGHQETLQPLSKFVRVRVKLHDATVYIVCSNEPVDQPTYRIDNKSDRTVFYKQTLPTDVQKSSGKERSMNAQDPKENAPTFAGQLDPSDDWLKLKPGQSSLFAWEVLSAPKPHTITLVIAEKGKSQFPRLQRSLCVLDHVQLDEIRSGKKPLVHKSSGICVLTHVDSATKALHIYNKRTEETGHRRRLSSTTERVEKVSFFFVLNVPRFGISVVDQVPRELLYFTITNMKILLSLSDLYQKLEVQCGDVQLDCQLSGGVYPVVLRKRHQYDDGSATVAKKQPSSLSSSTSIKAREPAPQLPFLKFTVIKVQPPPDPPGFERGPRRLNRFEYVGLGVQEFVVQIDQTCAGGLVPFVELLNSHLAFTPPTPSVVSSSPSATSNTPLTSMVSPLSSSSTLSATASGASNNGPGDVPPAAVHVVIEPQDVLEGRSATLDGVGTGVNVTAEVEYVLAKLDYSSTSRLVYLEEAELQPIRFTFSFAMNADSSFDSMSDMISNKPITTFGKTVFVMVANVENARIKLAGKKLIQAFTNIRFFRKLLLNHYKSQVKTQMYELLGSANMLGNPIGLINNLGTGVFDLFNEPTSNIKGVGDFGVGVAKGVGSFVKNSLYGLANTASSITGSLGNAIAALSADPKYLEKRVGRRVRQPEHAGMGLVKGGVALGRGIFDGVTGVVTSPFEGAKHDGASGFVKGVGQGIVGLLVKPIAGVLDAANSVTDGIKNTTTLFDKQVKRVRAPRTLYGPDRLMRVYSAKEAQVACFLSTTGELLLHAHRQELYIDHITVNYKHPGKESQILKIAFVITNRSFLSLRLDTANRDAKLVYVYGWDEIERVEIPADSASVAIHLRGRHGGVPSIPRRIVQCGKLEVAEQLARWIRVQLEELQAERGSRIGSDLSDERGGRLPSSSYTATQMRLSRTTSLSKIFF